MKEQIISDLESSMVFFAKVLYNEIDHDQQLVDECRDHLKNLTRIHTLIKEGQVVVE